MFQGPLTESILARAQSEGLLDIHLHDIRASSLGNYKQVDDTPYGGGAGMVLRVDVLVPAIEAVLEEGEQSFSFLVSSSSASTNSGIAQPKTSNQKLVTGDAPQAHRVLLSARGKTLTQEKVEELSKLPSLLLVCGHYEGVDERVTEGGWIDEEISIGDFVLTGGELPAMVLIDAIARQIPGVLGESASAEEESFSEALGRKREYPHYTRPEEFRGLKVPEVLLSGNHKEIEKWRRGQLR